MPDVLADVPVVWLGLTLTTAVFAGVAFQFPTSTPAPVDEVVTTIESVAGSPYPSTATHPVEAAVRVGPHRLALRTDAGVVHATIEYGPVTPVPRGSVLEPVLDGAPPQTVFSTETAFRDAVTTAQQRGSSWRTAVDRLVVRRVSWGEYNATLVTA